MRTRTTNRIIAAAVLLPCALFLFHACGNTPRTEGGVRIRGMANTPQKAKGVEITIPGLGFFRLGPVQPKPIDDDFPRPERQP